MTKTWILALIAVNAAALAAPPAGADHCVWTNVTEDGTVRVHLNADGAPDAAEVAGNAIDPTGSCSHSPLDGEGDDCTAEVYDLAGAALLIVTSSGDGTPSSITVVANGEEHTVELTDACP